MARRQRAPGRRRSLASDILQPPDDTLLDLLDRLLNKGVTLTGDVTLGVAGVDLIYLRLSSLLCAVDRIGSSAEAARPKTRPIAARRRPRGLLLPRGRA